MLAGLEKSPVNGGVSVGAHTQTQSVTTHGGLKECRRDRVKEPDAEHYRIRCDVRSTS
eukprot:SAG11_NODE_2879_length_2876_cov_1.398632_1_plen_58_part_00